MRPHPITIDNCLCTQMLSSSNPQSKNEKASSIRAPCANELWILLFLSALEIPLLAHPLCVYLTMKTIKSSPRGELNWGESVAMAMVGRRCWRVSGAPAGVLISGPGSVIQTFWARGVLIRSVFCIESLHFPKLCYHLNKCWINWYNILWRYW